MDDDEWNKLEHLDSIAVREGWLWGRAVSRLAGRIEKSSGGIDDQVDAALLAVAYTNVYRAALLARDHVSEQGRNLLDEALARVDQGVPGARQVRDMLEHFDEYERGAGRLQQPGRREKQRCSDEALAQEHRIYFERGTEGFILHVGDATLPVRRVRDAARELLEAMHTAGNAPTDPPSISPSD
jgi:hypothetical protein